MGPSVQGARRASTRYQFGDPELPGAFERPAVTVGVFDGVHQGHREILSTLVEWAGGGSVPPVAITFAHHPRRVLEQGAPQLITSLEHRLLLLERAGMKGVVVLPFDREMASWSPEEFVRRVFVDTLGASRVLVGKNHRFGQDRAGDFPLLARLGEKYGFEAREVELKRTGCVISSSAIRERIASGQLAQAAELLGRPVSVLGRVVQGEQRGRTLGFPTANLELSHAVRPPNGVYAARVRVVDQPEELLPAVVNIGRRPTFHPEAELGLVEVHLLAGGRDLYDQELEVLFVDKLREERRFAGPEDLKVQIGQDVARARELLA